MKLCYTKVISFLAFNILVFFLPGKSHAQCMCSDGSPANVQQHTISTSFSSNSTTICKVPQFDATVGTLAGKRFVRVRQVAGKITRYPQIKVLFAGTNAINALNIYPNPVVRNINLRFDEPLSGDYSLELANQAGQIVLQRKVRLNNSMTLEVLVEKAPPPGFYFLRARRSG